MTGAGDAIGLYHVVGNLLDVMVHLPHQNCDHRKWLVTARPLQEPWLTIFARQSSALEHTTAAEWVREPQQPLQGLSVFITAEAFLSMPTGLRFCPSQDLCLTPLAQQMASASPALSAAAEACNNWSRTDQESKVQKHAQVAACYDGTGDHGVCRSALAVILGSDNSVAEASPDPGALTPDTEGEWTHSETFAFDSLDGTTYMLTAKDWYGTLRVRRPPVNQLAAKAFGARMYGDVLVTRHASGLAEDPARLPLVDAAAPPGLHLVLGMTRRLATGRRNRPFRRLPSPVADCAKACGAGPTCLSLASGGEYVHGCRCGCWPDAVSAPEACRTCGAVPGAGPKYCDPCRNVMYCSKECQRSDWPRHKLECSTLSSM